MTQELFAIDADKILALPESFSLDQGALVEPAAVAVHAAARAGRLDGKNVVVLGAGPIGNLVAQATRCRGANVLIGEISPRRLEVAAECGLEQVVTGPLTSRHFDFDDYPSAYECIDHERDNVMKIMIDL